MSPLATNLLVLGMGAISRGCMAFVAREMRLSHERTMDSMRKLMEFYREMAEAEDHEAKP